MKPNKKPLYFALPLALFVGLLAMLGLRLGKPSDTISDVAVGKPLPAFALPLLSDPTQTHQNADLPKTPFLLNVWGSWCPTCYVEHPYLLLLAKQGVPMVGVNYKDDLAKATAYLQEHGDPFLFSLRDEKGDLALDLGLMGAPETFVVDSQGVVRMRVVGQLHEGNFAADVQPCLQALATSDVQSQQTACAAKVVRP